MVAVKQQDYSDIKHPINLNSQELIDNKQHIFKYLRDEAPVYKGKLMVLNAYFVSRYEDCTMVLKDPRFVRDRSTATGGGGKLPFPMPKSVQRLAQSMITEDDPEHRRLRDLVHKAFTPAKIRGLGDSVETLAHQLLDSAEKQGEVDLIQAFALPIPVTVIAGMMGVTDEQMTKFSGGVRALTDGLTGLTLIRTLLFDMPKMTSFVSKLIEEKRNNPQDDILTALIHAEEDGETLSEDELLSMVYLLIIAGYETTVHLISNAVVTLLEHPDQLAMLRGDMSLMDSAIEEILRYRGPVEGTKPHYPTEDVTLHGVTIPKGKMVATLLGAANHDERVFDNPEVFNITRNPNPHLGFGRGIHYCLGAPLARLEAKIALTALLERNPNLQLAIPSDDLKVMKVPSWHRYERVPVKLG